MKRKIIAVAMAAVMTASLTACGTAKESSNTDSASSGSTTVETAPVDYSYGLTDEGYYEGVNLSDYVTLPDDYKAFTFAESEIVPSEDDWNSYYNYIVSSIGEKGELPDAVAEDGSFVTIDFVGKIDGAEFTGGSAENTSMQIGAGQYLEELETAIIGHKAGDTFDVEITFPEGYGSTTDANGEELNLSGKTAVFSVTLKSIDNYTLTDEAITEYFSAYNEGVDDSKKITNVESMKNDFMNQFTESNLKNAILSDLKERVTITEIPAAMKDAYVKVEMDLTEYNAESVGMSVDSLVQNNGFESADDYKQYVADNSDAYLTNQLILLAIAEKEGITYDEESCREAFSGEPSELIEAYGQGYVAQNVICYKALETLKDAAVVE